MLHHVLTTGRWTPACCRGWVRVRRSGVPKRNDRRRREALSTGGDDRRNSVTARSERACYGESADWADWGLGRTTVACTWRGATPAPQTAEPTLAGPMPAQSLPPTGGRLASSSACGPMHLWDKISRVELRPGRKQRAGRKQRVAGSRCPRSQRELWEPDFCGPKD
jgi:hypothetical protein